MKILSIVKYPGIFKGAKITVSPSELQIISNALKEYSTSQNAGPFEREAAKEMCQKTTGVIRKSDGNKHA